MMAAAFRLFLTSIACLCLGACARGPIASASESERALIASAMMRDIEVLASDEFGGRKPGTLGEELTVDYLTQQMKAAGLVSGTNDPGSEWRADVPLVSTQPFTSRVAIRYGAREKPFDEADSAAFTSRRRALVERAGTVFVGRLGYEAPDEMVAGRIVIMLDGVSAENPGGTARTGTDRRAELFAKGAAAVITVVQNRAEIKGLKDAFGYERVALGSDEDLTLSAYVTQDAIAAALGVNSWRRLVGEALRGDFKPQPLNALATIEATSQRREFVSYNVIGKLPGTDPYAGAVMMLAHWDHLGECGSSDAADKVCNGAVDNASGLAAMLEVTRRLKAAGPHDRDIYVLATSAEEAGLLGAKAFVDAPPIPLPSIIAAFNFDTSAIAPAGSPVGFVGEGRTMLDPVIRDVLDRAERELGDKDFADQFVQRQDGWALLSKGVPAVFLSTAFGSRAVLGPYLESDYHSSSDEMANIELGGAIDDVLLHEELIRHFADTGRYQP